MFRAWVASLVCSIETPSIRALDTSRDCSAWSKLSDDEPMALKCCYCGAAVVNGEISSVSLGDYKGM